MYVFFVGETKNGDDSVCSIDVSRLCSQYGQQESGEQLISEKHDLDLARKKPVIGAFLNITVY